MNEAEGKIWPNSEIEHHCKINCRCWFSKIRAKAKLEYFRSRAQREIDDWEYEISTNRR